MTRPLSTLTRRRFLGAAGGLSLAATLTAAGCSSPKEESSAKKSPIRLLLPGTVPVGWQPVLDKVNAKMQTDLGFTIAPQFINWSQYGAQALLKFTAGENFDTALQARWLNMTQLVGNKALVDLNPMLSSGSYPNLTKTLAPKLLELNSWGGKLYGIPQVNSAARLMHFSTRQDLMEKVGMSEITDYAGLEKYFYDLKQRESSIIPFGVSSNLTYQTVVPGPVALFNAHAWENPSSIAFSFNGNSVSFVFATDAKATGSSRPVPFYEAPGVVEAMRTTRKYYQDGIINRDALNADSAAISGLFNSGKVASVWAISDGGSSNSLPALQKAVPGAKLTNVMPLRGGLTSKPNQTFQSDNFTVFNAKGQSNSQAMQIEDYFSIKENHDLISYGVEGTDYEPVSTNQYKALTAYAFPGYALCWRSSLELRSQYMNAAETKIFDWAQDYGNFTVDPFATFIPDVRPVKREDAQIAAAMTQYANPLFVGAVDVDSGLDKLKRALAAAGLDKVQAEMQTQADAHLKAAS